MSDKVIVHYHQYWLPITIEVDDESGCTNRSMEIVLEPYVLSLCLLRKLTNLRIVLVPSVYNNFVDGELPAALIDDLDCISGIPLRQDKLINKLIIKANENNNINSIDIKSNFELYDQNKINNETIIDIDIKKDIIIPTYIYSNLRFIILYLIWVHPVISLSFTRKVIANSMPLLYSYYFFYKKRSDVKYKCSLFGYSNLDYTIKELYLLLGGLKSIIQRKSYTNRHGNINLLEGYIFSNLAVLFSIPCKDIDEILNLHQEFTDLKLYCIKLNKEYNLVSLKPPFLSGDSISTSSFTSNSKLANVINCIFNFFDV